MTSVLLLLTSPALAVAGFASLSLSMDRHGRDVLGQRLLGARRGWVRAMGWLLLALSFPPWLFTGDWTVGLVTWCGLLSLAAGLVATVLSAVPHWTLRLGGSTALLAVGTAAAALLR